MGEGRMEEERATRFSIVIEGDGRGLLADTKINQDKPKQTKKKEDLEGTADDSQW